MLCERCHQREAAVKFTQVVGNEKASLHLCKMCAEGQGLNNPLLDISKVFGKIIIAILSEHLASKTDTSSDQESDDTVCTGCGISWQEFKAKGRFGCAVCYDTFTENLKTLLRRLHGNNRHIGKNILSDVQRENESVISLKEKLQKAVEKEEYEVAAELRDRIRKFTRMNGC
jgi:protein arginine kinase activator